MSAHTPGPWRANGHQINTSNGMGLSVAIVFSPKVGYAPKTEEEREANARLIAAAPELLQELRNIANADTTEWDDRAEFEAWAKSRARSAITKATGGAL